MGGGDRRRLGTEIYRCGELVGVDEGVEVKCEVVAGRVVPKLA